MSIVSISREVSKSIKMMVAPHIGFVVIITDGDNITMSGNVPDKATVLEMLSSSIRELESQGIPERPGNDT